MYWIVSQLKDAYVISFVAVSIAATALCAVHQHLEKKNRIQNAQYNRQALEYQRHSSSNQQRLY